MTDDKDIQLDKLQIATVRLADTIYGFFAGNHPATTIDNARATVTLIQNIRNHLKQKGYGHSPDLEFDTKSLETTHGIPDSKKWNAIQNRDNRRIRLLSNFTKHADKDANRIGEFSTNDTINALSTAQEDYITLISWLKDLDNDPLGESLLTKGFNEKETPTETMCYIFMDWYMECAEKTNILIQESVSNAPPEEDIKDTITQKQNFFNTQETKHKYRQTIEDQNLWPIDLSQEASFRRDWVKKALNLEIKPL